MKHAILSSYFCIFILIQCGICKGNSGLKSENEIENEDDNELASSWNNGNSTSSSTESPPTTKKNTVPPTTTRSPAKSKKLLFVQLVFRHGDRSPIIIYKTNPNPPDVWEEGLGKLTKLGRKQHYALGKYLRNRYKDFATFNPNEIDVVSTDYDRTKRSAESNLAGFFAPTKEWEIDENLVWQPIPVKYISIDQDRWLMPSVSCPRAAQDYSQTLSSPFGQKFTAEHTETFQKLSNYSGEKDLDLQSAENVFDNLIADKMYNHIVPAWAEQIWDEMDRLRDLPHRFLLESPVSRRLRAGPLTKRLLENMNKKISDKLSQLKFQVYSAHDSTVASSLHGFDVFNKKHPPYCATAIFELHELTDGSNALRILYLNSTDPEKKIDDPYVLTIKGCSEYCPLDFVVNFVNDTLPVDWDNECRLDY